MNVYAFITPVVVLLLIAEILYCRIRGKNYYNFQDTITNLGTGIGNQCVNLAVVFIIYHGYGWLYQFAPWQVPVTWYTGLLLLVLMDFVFYWFHRTGHSINIFWAAHMPHHSSEELNLSVGIRASFTQRIFQFVFFDWIFPLIGFSPDFVYAVAGIHLLIAYWHHTQLIGKLGWVEKIFVTPSHHRVHHGVNTQYLDKNFSEFLIIWDRIFGSFEEEKEEVCYGVTKAPQSWNPIAVNLQFWRQLWADAVAAPRWWDKIRLWFMPLGWRPPGVGDGPLPRIGYTRAEQVKYQSRPLAGAEPYLIAQVVTGIAYMYFAINLSFPFSGWERLLLSVGIFMMIIAWSGILQRKSWALPLELTRLAYQGICLFTVLYVNEMTRPWGIASILILMAVGLSMSWAAWRFNGARQAAA